MRIWLLGAVVAIAGVGVAWLLRTRSAVAEPKAEEGKSAAVTKELRDRLLRAGPSDFGIAPDGRVWGVLMETGYPEAAATLVALTDGSASLYFSSGGGVIGGGPHEGINAAARRLVRLADEFVSRMSPVTQFPLPASGRTKFYVLTTSGVVSSEAPEEDLGAGDHAFSPLFFAGHDVITGLRQASDQPAP